MRSVYKAWWLSAMLVGCSATDDSARLTGSAATSPIFAELSPVGDDNVVFVRPQETRTLSVRLLAAKTLPLAGATVEFALLEGAKGASIDAQSGITDADGQTSVQLTAGTTATTFSLRASYVGAAPLVFTITVREAQDPTLRVSVDYAGKRPVVQRSVTVVPSMTCEQVLASNSVGDKTYSYSDATEQPSFLVGSGMRYAVAAWGRDDTGGRLARGCAEQMTGISAEDNVVLDVDVSLLDETITLAGDFPWVLDGQLAGIGDAIAPLLDRALTAVATSYGVSDEPTLVVERLRRDFTQRGGSAEVFDQARPLLTSSLATRDRGRDFSAAYAALVELHMASLSITGVLHTQGKSFSVDVTASQCSDPTGMWSVSLPNSGSASVQAGFDADRAVIAISALHLPLSLADLVSALTVTGGDPSSVVDTLSSGASCAAFSAALAGDAAFTAVCDADCVSASCRGVIESLVAASAIQLQNSASNELLVTGDLATHARDSSAVVDVGPTTLSAVFGDVLTLMPTLRSTMARSSAL